MLGAWFDRVCYHHQFPNHINSSSPNLGFPHCCISGNPQIQVVTSPGQQNDVNRKNCVYLQHSQPSKIRGWSLLAQPYFRLMTYRWQNPHRKPRPQTFAAKRRPRTTRRWQMPRPDAEGWQDEVLKCWAWSSVCFGGVGIWIFWPSFRFRKTCTIHSYIILTHSFSCLNVLFVTTPCAAEFWGHDPMVLMFRLPKLQWHKPFPSLRTCQGVDKHPWNQKCSKAVANMKTQNIAGTSSLV